IRDSRLAGRVGALPRDPDGDALRAEVALALGRFDDAREVVAALPADHWRACSVRAALYELDGDVDRAESAGVAAIHLAPPARRPALTRRLTALRTRHRRTVSPPLTLWERPPQDP
ncbi:MAG: hypothetical protein ABMB14_17365, partial [Myxococcota bacterium]